MVNNGRRQTEEEENEKEEETVSKQESDVANVALKKRIRRKPIDI